MLFILSTFYVAMVISGYLIEIIFSFLHLIPNERTTRISQASISWNYTTFLNVIFLLLAGILLYRFINSGGLGMLKMMNKTSNMDDGHIHEC